MPTAVLLSGGLDSAVLLAEEAARGAIVQPIYVSVGLAWEARGTGGRARSCSPPTAARPHAAAGLAGRRHARRVRRRRTGRSKGALPATTRPTRTCICPGRNIVLLGKAGVYCAAAGIDRLVLGTLAHNPIPRRDAGVSIGDGRRAVARPRPRADDRRTVRRRQQGGSHQRAGWRWACRSQLTLSCMSPIRQRLGKDRCSSTAAHAASAASATTHFSRPAVDRP